MRSSLLLLLALLPALAQAQGPILTLTSPNPEDPVESLYFGVALSGVPDANGDGLSDLLVGATNESGGALGAGRAYLFSGATGALLHTLESSNPKAYGDFGGSVSALEDADGDGRGDLLVGAFKEDVGRFSAGRAYVYSGATGALLRSLVSPHPERYGAFGGSVSGVADADGDGKGDLLVGAPGEVVEGVLFAGRAYLFSGATGALLHTLTKPHPEGHAFGRAVAGVPDADGDGRGDLLVSSANDEGELGRVSLFSGATGALLRTITGGGTGFYDSYFGYAVSGVEDAGGDGRGDLLISDPFRDHAGFDAGSAYLYSGATGAGLYDFRSPSPSDHNLFGYWVSGVADVNGDGHGDLLISDTGTEQALLYSGASGNLLRALQSPVGNPDSYGFGGPVAGVEDADGDGRGDLLVAGNVLGESQVYLFSGAVGAVTVAASGSPTTISPGGAVTVTATVANNTSAPLTGDLWVVATRDGDAVLTRRIGSGTLPAGATATRSFALTSPGATPPGVYTVAVNAGRFPGVVRASDAFDVTVTGGRLGGAASAAPFVVEAVAGDVFAADALALTSSSPLVAVSPNPFAGRTTLRFALAEAGAVRLGVYDALGREVTLLADGAFEAGAHTATFDARGLSAGVYVWRLASGGAVRTGRLTLLD